MSASESDPLLSIWPFPGWGIGRLRDITDPNDREAFAAWLKKDPEASSRHPIRVRDLPDEYQDWYWEADRLRYVLDIAFMRPNMRRRHGKGPSARKAE